MSDDRDVVAPAVSTGSTLQAAAQPLSAAAPAAVTSQLEAIEDIDFLLEEIENKIAPLALA